jgi:IclR helix-turn-helix domain
MSENGITIELSSDQVNRVIREIAEDDGMSPVGGMEQSGFRASPAQLDDRRLSRSLLLGLMVLASFRADGASRPVAEVAQELDMGLGMTRRYIFTLVKVGLLERDPALREYRLAGRG